MNTALILGGGSRAPQTKPQTTSGHAAMMRTALGTAGNQGRSSVFFMNDEVEAAHPYLADGIEELAKKLGKKPEELKALAKEKGFDLDDPEKLKQFEAIAGKGGDLFGAISNTIGGKKDGETPKKDETKAATKPRTKEEAQTALTVRAASSVGAGAAVGIGVGVVTKNPLYGVLAGAGAFIATAVGFQIISPLTSDDLDKILKEEPKKAATAEKDAKPQTGEQKK